MFSFEGDFRRKPLQSLRGASRKDQTADLLLRNQKERQKREDQRKRLSSAIKIQSFYRGATTRASQKNVERERFDAVFTKTQRKQTYMELHLLTKKLLFFYSDATDSQRLTNLCQIILKQRELILGTIQEEQGDSTLFQIKHLLVLCCRYLETIASSSAPLAVPMRMLEVFTDPQTYAKHVKDPGGGTAKQIVEHIMVYLVGKGYLTSLRNILEYRVPSGLERSPNPPVPVAHNLFLLTIKPLQIVTESADQNIRNIILCSFCREFFCQEYSDQIHQFLIPALAAMTDAPFPFIAFLHTLLPDIIEDTEQGVKTPTLSVPASPWLLYAVLQLSKPHFDSLSDADVIKYLQVLQVLTNELPSLQLHPDDEDSDDEDDNQMDCDDLSLTGLPAVKEECLRCLDDPKLIRCMVLAVQRDPRPSTVLAVCTICHTLMQKHKIIVHKAKLLYSLAFNSSFIRNLWQICVSMTAKNINTGSHTALLQLLSRGLSMTLDEMNRIVPVLSVFCSMFCSSILTLHDAEFFGENENSATRLPFAIPELVAISRTLRDACLGIIELAHPDSKPTLTDDYRKAFKSIWANDLVMSHKELQSQTETWAYLFKVTVQLVKQLYARDRRKSFCPDGHWLSNRVSIQADKPSQLYSATNNVFVHRRFGDLSILNRNPNFKVEDEGPPLSTTEARNLTILTELPFVVPFHERVKIFQKLLLKDKQESQSEMHDFGSGQVINCMIRRNYLYEDAFEKLSVENEPNLKLRMRVQLVNFAGLDEAGIDGGGVFREFLSELLKTSFDPNRGFFKTTMERSMYPNPHANLIADNFTVHYFFMGRILGKALYENMLVELPFAAFFLSKILSRHSGDVDIHHLASLDPEVYKNLLYLKNYEGDVSQLELDFTVTNNVLGETVHEELVPGGRDIAVTSLNRIEYIHRVADYRLNKQIRAQCNAFRQGLADVINLEWLRMFDQNELQVLVSGAHIPVDVDDLKQHTNYSGGYNTDHPVIKTFWKIVGELTDQQKRHLLRFVTSCSRPPLLGFKELYPAFCIHYGGSEGDRLPTASTCMNLLKLPEFRDEETMRSKLLYAIESGAGFELS
ncbi:ubiquitin-protein ligase E3C-like isoform X2 [Lineus longissimus]|uniref:ubiquitin-protein ligase E3C-like isoform X2 n=1 Tax=Lineus longissimus TaxID=88925 RepID=UPI00315C8533